MSDSIIKSTKDATVSTEQYYRERARFVRKIDRKLAEKADKVADAAKEVQDYIKSREQ